MSEVVARIILKCDYPRCKAKQMVAVLIDGWYVESGIIAVTGGKTLCLRHTKMIEAEARRLSEAARARTDERAKE